MSRPSSEPDFNSNLHAVGRFVSTNWRQRQKNIQENQGILRACSQHATNKLGQHTPRRGSSRAQRPNPPPGQHVCKLVFAHAFIFCAARLPGGAEISARVTQQKVLFFAWQDASEKPLVRKREKKTGRGADGHFATRAAELRRSWNTRGVFMQREKKKAFWKQS